jgi:hypothetical protein
MGVLILSGCAAGPSRLYQNGAFGAPEGSLRLAEVVELAPKSFVQTDPGLTEPLAAAGIRDAGTRDGSIGAGRVYCCGGMTDKTDLLMFYIPAGLAVAPGDIVEMRCGREPRAGATGSVNTVTRVVQTRDDPAGACRWVPPDRQLLRILYCDWMPKAGWVNYTGAILREMWIKPSVP